MDGERPRVLFVDDEPHVLSGLRRSVRVLEPRWDVLTAPDGATALGLLDEQACDAVISDMRMPGMDGAQVLTAVQQRHPATVRIVLSGAAERGPVLSAAAAAHRFLAKPCETGVLVDVVRRALQTRRRLTDPALRELIGGVAHLPTLPAVYDELVAAMAQPQTSVQHVARIVARDVATSVEVLKLTNSAFFGATRRIESITQAASMLGLNTIQALVVATAAFHEHDEHLNRLMDVAGLRRRALQRSAMVRRIGTAEGWPAEEVTTLSLAALLRDIGLLVLGPGRPEAAAAWTAERTARPALLDDPVAFAERERDLFGCSVSQASAYLLDLWGFSHRLVHTVAGQPTPDGFPGAEHTDYLLTLVAQRVERPALPYVNPPDAAGPDGARQLSWNASCAAVLGTELEDLEVPA